jgi:hypothetical protein
MIDDFLSTELTVTEELGDDDKTYDGEFMSDDEFETLVEDDEPYGVPDFKTKRDARVYRFCLLGASNDDLCKMLNVCMTTFQNWRKTKPEFARAINLGKHEADTRVVESLFNRAVGYSHKETKLASHMGRFTGQVEIDKHYPPEVNAIKLWLINRESTKEKWQDVSRSEVTGPNGQPLQTLNANIDVTNMSNIEKASRLVTVLQQAVNKNKGEDDDDGMLDT